MGQKVGEKKRGSSGHGKTKDVQIGLPSTDGGLAERAHMLHSIASRVTIKGAVHKEQLPRTKGSMSTGQENQEECRVHEPRNGKKD